jgi:cytoskeletal protein CcmA (bactofilin family)
MFGKTKDGTPEGERVPAPVQQFQRLAAQSSALQSSSAKASDEVSSISAGMTVVGKISGQGTVQIFGRIEGELHASTVLVAEGADVEGDIVADDLTVGGRVKGTIRASRVKLNGTAAVEGDIFHRSLSIEENARFEGSSRRDDTATETPRMPLARPAVQAQKPSQVPSHLAPDSAPKINGAPDKGAHANPAG